MATYRATVQIVHFEPDENDRRFSHNMPLSEPWNIVFKTWNLFDVGQKAYELAATQAEATFPGLMEDGVIEIIDLQEEGLGGPEPLEAAAGL